MPILDAVRNREYKREKQREYRAKWKLEKANGDSKTNGDTMIDSNRTIDGSMIDAGTRAQAEEIRKLGQEYFDRADRIEAEAMRLAAASTPAGNEGLDRYGKQKGTTDDQGRELGQLDAHNAELATLNVNLSKLEQTRSQLKAALSPSRVMEAQTTEARIDAKTKAIAIRELIEENETEIVTLKGTIKAKEERAAKLEAEAERHRKDIVDYTKGGSIYVNKMAYAEINLRQAEQDKSAAQGTLASKNYPEHDNARQQLQSAESRIETHTLKNVEAYLDAQRVKAEDLLRVYTLKD